MDRSTGTADTIPVLETESPGNSPYQIARIVRDILIFVVLVTGTVFLLRPLQKYVLERMAELREVLVSYAEDFLGRSIEYGTIIPALSHLDVQNITIAGANPGALPTLSVTRIRLSYSLISLIRGQVIRAIHGVYLDNPVIHLDQEQDADLVARLFTGTGTEAISLDQILSHTLSMAIQNGSVSFTGPTVHFFIADINADASLNNKHIRFQTSLAAAGAMTESMGNTVSLEAMLNITGTSNADFTATTGSFTVLGLSGSSKLGELFQLKPVTIDVTLAESTIKLNKRADRFPVDITAWYNFVSGGLSGRLECNNFVVRDMLSLDGPWKTIDPWLVCQASGSAIVQKDTNAPLYYSVNMAGTVPETVAAEMASFSIIGNGTLENININQLICQVSQGTAQFQGKIGLNPFNPRGVLDLSQVSLSGTQPFDALFAVAMQGDTVSVSGSDIVIGAVPLALVNGSVTINENDFGFALSTVHARGTVDSRLLIEGSFDYHPGHLSADITLDSFPPMDVVALLGPFLDTAGLSFPAQDIMSALRVSTEVYITTDFEHISYNATNLALKYHGEQPVLNAITVSTALSGNEKWVAFTNGTIGYRDTLWYLAGELDFADSDVLAFNVDARYKDIPYQVTGTFIDQRSLNIHGLYDLWIQFELFDGGMYSVFFETNALPMPYWGEFARISISSQFKYESGEAWHVDLNRLDITDVVTPVSKSTTLNLAGVADQAGLSVNQLVFNDGRGTLSGTMSGLWSYDFSNLSGLLSLYDEASNEYYAFSGSRQDAHIELHLNGSQMQLARFIPESYNAIVTGTADISWDSWTSYQAAVDVLTLTASVNGSEAALQCRVSLNNDEFSIEDFSAQYAGLQLDVPTIHAGRLTGRVETTARLSGMFLGLFLNTEFAVGLDYKPLDSWLTISEAFNYFQGSIIVTTAELHTMRSDQPFYFDFNWRDAVFSLSGGPRDMIRFKFFDRGDFYAGISAPSPVRGSVTGTIFDQKLEAQISNLYVDLASLFQFFPASVTHIINVPGGFATASSIRVAGPVGDPEFFGTVIGNAVRIQVPQYLQSDIRVPPMTVVLNGNEMFLDTTYASVGAGVATVGAYFLFDRWVPDTFTVSIQVRDTDPIPFRCDVLGVLSQGDVSGNLDLSMDKANFTTSGDLTVNDTEITLNVSEMMNQKTMTNSATDNVFMIDLMLHTGRKVRFLWPTAEFPLVQANADMGTTLAIKSDTATGRFSLVGDVKLRSGEIFYFQRSFYIREGTLSFNENEVHFDPKLSARAEIRDRNDSGPVTVRMIIDNASITQEFTPRWEASPSLSQMEILTLLGQNLAGNSGTGGNSFGNAIIASSADFLTQTQVVRRFEQMIRDFLHLDMFTFRTQVFQNMVLQATGLRESDNRVNWAGNYFDNTTVFLGKYIGQDMFFQTMIQMRYDDGGSTGLGLRLGGLIFEPEFGLGLRGPTINMGWLGSPRLDLNGNITLLHPENLFVNDFSFTFLLNWSF
jgi:hypothetical protein